MLIYFSLFAFPLTRKNQKWEFGKMGNWESLSPI